MTRNKLVIIEIASNVVGPLTVPVARSKLDMIELVPFQVAMPRSKLR